MDLDCYPFECVLKEPKMWLHQRFFHEDFQLLKNAHVLSILEYVVFKLHGLGRKSS